MPEPAPGGREPAVAPCVATTAADEDEAWVRPTTFEDVQLTPKLPDEPAEPKVRALAMAPAPSPTADAWLPRVVRALREVLGPAASRPASARPRREEPPAQPSPAAPAPPPPPTEPPHPTRAPAPASAFAPFARLLGIEEPAEPEALPPEEEAGDAALASKVLELFATAPLDQASFPAIATEILALVSSPDADVGRLAATLSRDPALAAGVISVANSPLFRGASEVETVRGAVTRLGLQEVGRVAVAVATRTLFDAGARATRTAFGEGSGVLFARSVTVGAAAAALGMRLRGARTDRAYLGGLLHDVGKALALGALARGGPAAYGAEPEAARLARVLDRVHVEIGTAAHRAWALPQYLTSICEHHHDAHDAPVLLGDGSIDLHLVRVASALVALRDPPFAARAAREIVQSAAALRLDPYGVRALATELRQAEERTAALPF